MSQVKFAVKLLDELGEYSRQLLQYPKAMHPQMESLMGMREASQPKPVLTVASCGFTQLGMMEKVEDELAEAVQMHKYGLLSQSVVSISAGLLQGLGEGTESATLSTDAAYELQVFLGVYANTVYGIRDPLAINLSPVPAQDTVFEGVRWLTYAFNYVLGVEKEEWDKLYELKKSELLWATKIKQEEELKVSLAMNQVMSKLTH